jgi:hypothetical protein
LARGFDVTYRDTMDANSLGFSCGTYHLTENAATELLCVEGLRSFDPYTQLVTGTLITTAPFHLQAFEYETFPAVPLLANFPHHQADWSLLADTSRSCGFDEWNLNLLNPYIHNA